MSRCTSCGNQCESSCCDICRIVAPHISGQNPEWITDEATFHQVLEEFGHPNPCGSVTLETQHAGGFEVKTTVQPNRIWSAVRKLHSPEIGWSVNQIPTHDDIGGVRSQLPKWELDEEDREIIESGIVVGVDEGRIGRLARGGTLPDGSHLCWADGSFYIEGYPLKLPYHGLSKLLRRKRGVEGVNWKLLLLSVSLASTSFNTPVRRHEPRRMRLRRGGVHPVAMMSVYRGNGLADNALDRMHRFMHLRGLNFTDFQFEGRKYDPQWFEDTSWMMSWEPIGKIGVRQAARMLVPQTLFIKNGRLQLRVKRDHGWRKLEVESHPEVWAKLATWALHPTDSRLHRRLRCLQQRLFASFDSDGILSKSDKKGIDYLHGIVSGNSNVTIDQKYRWFEVTGSSGCKYRVVPEIQGLNKRFTVSGIGHVSGPRHREREIPEAYGHGAWGRHRMHDICIDELPQLRRLVMGDALGGVILALLDDTQSQRFIHTIAAYICEATPRETDPEVEVLRQAENLRFRLRNNLAENRTRRYTELFPRLWSVLLRCPLAERLEFTAVRAGEPNLTFDGCETEFSTAGWLERRVIYMMLEASGWTRERSEEAIRGRQRIYIKTGTGPQRLANIVEEFAALLEPALLVNERVRLVSNPAWSFFERDNPGICELLPGTNQRLD